MTKFNTKTIALIGMFVALAVIGRTLMAPIPSVQPVTAIVVISGILLGKRAGLSTGILVALLTGITTGLGWWTIAQAVGWGVGGLIGGMIRVDQKRLMIMAGVVATVAFSIVMNGSGAFMMGLPLSGYLAYATASLPFDLIHLASTVGFTIVLLPIAIALFKRFDSALIDSRSNIVKK
ncbi:ECF transporter S component [Enterococcus faecalis]|nr:ECF transporter S component [Enterococcus faecalis]